MGELESADLSHIYIADLQQILTTLYSGMNLGSAPMKVAIVHWS